MTSLFSVCNRAQPEAVAGISSYNHNTKYKKMRPRYITFLFLLVFWELVNCYWKLHTHICIYNLIKHTHICLNSQSANYFLFCYYFEYNYLNNKHLTNTQINNRTNNFNFKTAITEQWTCVQYYMLSATYTRT